MSEFTKRKWEREGRFVYALNDKSINRFCCSVQGCDPDVSREELLANARLIAAAPKLYAACKAFVEAHEKSHQLEKTDVALKLAKAALAKAEEKK